MCCFRAPFVGDSAELHAKARDMYERSRAKMLLGLRAIGMRWLFLLFNRRRDVYKYAYVDISTYSKHVYLHNIHICKYGYINITKGYKKELNVIAMLSVS